MKTALIINPVSGGGRMKRIWGKYKTKIQSRIGAVEVFETKKIGDAAQLSLRAASNGFQRIVVGGGDGTVHEVINGLFDENDKLVNSQVEIGIFAGGRGCDFARSLQVSENVLEAADVMHLGKTRRVDVGRVKIENAMGTKVRYYINSASMGLGGHTAKRMQKRFYFLPPSLEYLRSGLVEFIGYKPIQMKLHVDGRPIFDGLAHNVFICNGRFSGGGMLWAPNGEVDDGEFDILLVKSMGKLKGLKSLPKLFDGTFQDLEEVSLYQGSQVEIQTREDEPVELDGEVYSGTNIVLTNIPQVVKFLVP